MTAGIVACSLLALGVGGGTGCSEDEVDPPVVGAAGASGAAGSVGQSGAAGEAGGGDAGEAGGGDAGAGGGEEVGGAFLGVCATADDCADDGAVCHTFPSKGLLCTLPCTDDAACPAPSPGCNPQGICRAP